MRLRILQDALVRSAPQDKPCFSDTCHAPRGVSKSAEQETRQFSASQGESNLSLRAHYDGKETAFDRMNPLHPHARPAEQIGELLSCPFFASQVHHHVHVGETMWVSDRLAPLEYDFSD